jgi:diacylglycerol O-acyltransferase/trehalose O-mycolyltransferase
MGVAFRRMARVGLAALLLAGLLGGCGHGGVAAAPTPTAKPASPVVAQHRVAPRQVDLTVRSTALGRSAKLRLLTPAGWTQSSSKRWPVLYLLHGCCDTYESWTRSTDIAELPQLRDVLVVMPEGGDIGFYSNWRDGPRWQDFHLRELPRILEPYGAGPRRAIAGLSMGGLGAMDYAARRPRMFRAAASFSGVLHPLGVPRFWLGLFSQYTSDPREVWGDPDTDRANWRRHDPTALLPALKGLPLFVSAGDGRGATRDAIEAEVGAESRAFARRARALHVPLHAELYPGGTHDWPYWQRELHRALPLLLGPLR